MQNTDSDTPIFFNQISALGRVRGNKALLVKLLDLYLNCEEITVLKESVAAENWESTAKALHAIKGIAGNLSLDELFEASKILEANLPDPEIRQILLKDYYNILTLTSQAVENYLNNAS